MPRRYKRTLGALKYHDFSEKHVQKAVDHVKQYGMSLREVSEVFGVPKSTIQRRVSGKNTGMYGCYRILSDDDKNALTDGIVETRKWGLPLTTFDIRLLVK
ncbi:hypothetical protein PR048_021767 [Dryococelus australis]|uniref:HTH psq-type domain-containing protein n=1 Tax=Dryococelus australis TaxID=614101 RepID=A0ABQ9GZB7_9NEOP|nr:hypothetical protein PR048_021767 [Dryococelus australis]